MRVLLKHRRTRGRVAIFRYVIPYAFLENSTQKSLWKLFFSVPVSFLPSLQCLSPALWKQGRTRGRFAIFGYVILGNSLIIQRIHDLWNIYLRRYLFFSVIWRLTRYWPSAILIEIFLFKRSKLNPLTLKFTSNMELFKLLFLICF